MGATALIRSPAQVLITGAAGGLGRALALEYAAPGRSLILHGRSEASLADVMRACKERGAQVTLLAFDLRDVEGFRARLREFALSTPIDLAIVNAGVSRADTGSEESWDDIQLMLDVNLRASLATVAALLPPMRLRRSGQIALIASLAAWHGLPLTPAYCASKAALKTYGEALRGSLAPHGIAVNVVLPGFVKTAMSDAIPGPKPFMISADDAARRIRLGLSRNSARISFPQPLAFGGWLLSALPASWSQAIVRRTGL